MKKYKTKVAYLAINHNNPHYVTHYYDFMCQFHLSSSQYEKVYGINLFVKKNKRLQYYKGPV